MHHGIGRHTDSVLALSAHTTRNSIPPACAKVSPASREALSSNDHFMKVPPDLLVTHFRRLYHRRPRILEPEHQAISTPCVCVCVCVCVCSRTRVCINTQKKNHSLVWVDTLRLFHFDLHDLDMQSTSLHHLKK
jgi:hypothetical protein